MADTTGPNPVDHTDAYRREMLPLIEALMAVAEREGIHLVIVAQHAINSERCVAAAGIVVRPQRMGVAKAVHALASVVTEVFAERKPLVPALLRAAGLPITVMTEPVPVAGAARMPFPASGHD